MNCFFSFPFISNAGALELDSMLRRLRNERFIVILTTVLLLLLLLLLLLYDSTVAL